MENGELIKDKVWDKAIGKHVRVFYTDDVGQGREKDGLLYSYDDSFITIVKNLTTHIIAIKLVNRCEFIETEVKSDNS